MSDRFRELAERLEKEAYWSRASSECSDFTDGEQEHYAILGALLSEAAQALRKLADEIREEEARVVFQILHNKGWRTAAVVAADAIRSRKTLT